ncbi:MAG TPA: histidine--tRNA ligase [Gemmatimonadaceae bacterium]|nr:histidine--tRNA ligase [Gemmatimonadaceae bacterium]
MSTGALPGFRDFYPAELAERSHIFAAWRDVARRFAFGEYDGPPLEPLELYTKKSGDEIVGQLYNFQDKGERQVALRPEMTPTVARMVAARANALRKPVRWFSLPQLFRYERQQKGRLREHFQLNVDIFGEPDVSADAELLAVAVEIMRALGLGPDAVRARVSDRRLLNAALLASGVTDAQLPATYAVIDKIERTPMAQSVQRLVDAGLTSDLAGEVTALVTQARSLDDLRARFADDAGVAEHLTRFDQYFAALDALGVREYVDLDLRIVRGLAYYTGIVFELFDATGEFRAICGGGRYDNLLQALGGVDMPALGFGMGDVVLGELLRARGLMPAGAQRIDFWVAPVAPSERLRAVRVATALRNAGASAEYPLRDQALGKQLKAAGNAGAARVVFVGPELEAQGHVEVKSLASGDQRAMPLDELIALVRDHSSGSSDRPW